MFFSKNQTIGIISITRLNIRRVIFPKFCVLHQWAFTIIFQLELSLDTSPCFFSPKNQNVRKRSIT